MEESTARRKNTNSSRDEMDRGAAGLNAEKLQEREKLLQQALGSGHAMPGAGSFVRLEGEARRAALGKTEPADRTWDQVASAMSEQDRAP
jgi:hypothetical protein